MANKVVGRCPICGEELMVTELQCVNCQAKISGRFELCKFCKLPQDQRDFAEVFIKNRGNIREVERELGISYPTVRSRLENLIKSLGYSALSEEPQDAREDFVARERKQILDRLADGEIGAQEATRLLKGLSER